MKGVFSVGPTIDPLFQTYMTATATRNERTILNCGLGGILTLIKTNQHQQCGNKQIEAAYAIVHSGEEAASREGAG